MNISLSIERLLSVYKSYKWVKRNFFFIIAYSLYFLIVVCLEQVKILAFLTSSILLFWPIALFVFYCILFKPYRYLYKLDFEYERLPSCHGKAISDKSVEFVKSFFLDCKIIVCYILLFSVLCLFLFTMFRYLATS
jgi:hypothetical protein